METIYLFDVDGTLTAPRQPMTAGFAEFFLNFVTREKVFLVSGSDYQKLEEQVPQTILDACIGVFGCSGAQFIQQNQLSYEREHQFSIELLESVKAFLCDSAYELRFGNHMEFRPGMLNISVVGRNANLRERQYYHEWDLKAQERIKFANHINENYPDYEASCGGEISIDIVPRGWNKSVVKAEVLKHFPGARLIFFGDRMDAGGNDQALAEVLNTPSGRHRAIPVNGYKDTWTHLNHITDAFTSDDTPCENNVIWEPQSQGMLH